MHRNTTWKAAQACTHSSIIRGAKHSPASITAAAQQRQPLHATEESLRLYRLAIMSGSSLISQRDDHAAVSALQRLSSSHWHTTRQFLRMVAAERGIDVESGASLTPATVTALPRHRQNPSTTKLSSPTSQPHHPAWSEAIIAETPEERLHVGVLRDMVAIEASHRLSSPSKAARLGTLYVLQQIHGILVDPALKARVLPWTLATLAKGLFLNHSHPTARTDAEVVPQTKQQRRREYDVPTPLSELYTDHIKQRLSHLDRRFPPWLREVDSIHYLTMMCSDVDELLLGRVANSLFTNEHVAPSSQSLWELPPHLHSDRLHEIFPKYEARPTSKETSVACVQNRLEWIIQRTLRGEVSQGVLIPDTDAVVNQFDRVVSLSQHREVLLPFRVLVELLQMASLDSTDWRKYRVRKHLKQLLSSVTTDRHVGSDEVDAADNYGGVTLLGISDELALESQSSRMQSSPSDGDDSSAAPLCYLGNSSTPESIAWTAKYVDLSRRRISQDGGRPQRSISTPPNLTDPIVLLLAGFGVTSRGGAEAKAKKPAVRSPPIGRVVVMSRDPGVQAACCAIGVEILA